MPQTDSARDQAAGGRPGERVWRTVLILVLVDAALTGPFVFPGAAEGDTIRYALGIFRWRQGLLALSHLFNAEIGFGYYAMARGLAAV